MKQDDYHTPLSSLFSHPQICMLVAVRRLWASAQFCFFFYVSRQTFRPGFGGGIIISLTHISLVKIGPIAYHSYLFTFFSSSLSPFFPPSLFCSLPRSTESKSLVVYPRYMEFLKHSYNPNAVRPALVLWTSLEVSSVPKGFKSGPAICAGGWVITGQFKGREKGTPACKHLLYL